MSNFVVVSWGKIADKLAAGCGRLTETWRSRFYRVHKQVSFHTLFTRFIQDLTHNQNNGFTDVKKWFLPTINTPNKDNDYLNKPLLLVGGCV